MDNLPDGMSVFDESAPWNQPIEPDVCCDCRFFTTHLVCGLTACLCLHDAIEDGDACVATVDQQSEACCDFEPRD